MSNFIKKKIFELKPNDISAEKWLVYCDEISSKLGWFIIAFNSLDEIITLSVVDLLAKAIDQDLDLNYIMVADRTFTHKVNSLELLILYYLEKYQNLNYSPVKINTLFQKIKEINSIRNNYVHADWYDTFLENDNINIKVKTKADKTGVYHCYLKVKPEEIEDQEELIEKLEKELSDIIKKIEDILYNERLENIEKLKNHFEKKQKQ